MSIAIIGAGISGCVTARECLKANHKVYLIEKSSSIGGRLATRRVGLPNNPVQLKADTGAQFITARSQVFKDEFIQPGLDGGYLHVWSFGGFADTNLAKLNESDRHPRYSSKIGLNGAINNSFSDLLVHPNFNLQLNTRVNSIRFNEKLKFELKFDNLEKLECNHVFISLPLPQAVPLIEDVVLKEDQISRFTCNVSNISALAHSKSYDPCLCLIIIVPSVVSKILINGGNGAKRVTQDSIIQWIASNNSKGMSGLESQEIDAITIHCNAQFSKENHGLSDAVISEKILSSSILQPYRDSIQSLSVKKWKYAVPLFSSEVRGQTLEVAVNFDH